MLELSKFDFLDILLGYQASVRQMRESEITKTCLSTGRNAQYSGTKLFIQKARDITYSTFLQIKILKHPRGRGIWCLVVITYFQ